MEQQDHEDHDSDWKQEIKRVEKKLDIILSLLTENQSSGKQTKTNNKKKNARLLSRQTQRGPIVIPSTNETKRAKEIQEEILREEHEELTERLDPNNGLMDHLVQAGAMEISDSEKVQSIQPRKDKVRYLLSRLHRYEPHRFEMFITALHETDPSIAKKLQTVYNARKNENNKPEVNCIHCLIKSRVDLGDIVDSLFKSHVVDVDFLEDYSLGKRPRGASWNHVFFNMGSWKEEENPVQLLKKSLPVEKYRDIVEALDQQSEFSRAIVCTRKSHNLSLQRLDSKQSTGSRDEESSSDMGSVLWSETVSASPNMINRAESFFDKRHDPLKHRRFVLKHSPLQFQQPVSESSLTQEDMGLPNFRNVPSIDSRRKIPPMTKTKDPRRIPIYCPSFEDLDMAISNALDRDASGPKLYPGRRVQSFNYGQRANPRMARKE